MIKTVTLFLSLMVAATAVRAQDQAQDAAVPGHFTGSGGEGACGEFTDTVSRIAAALFSIGQERIDKVNKLVNVQKLWDLTREHRCLPEPKLDRDARTDPETKISYLRTETWVPKSVNEKIRLAGHELAVLAKLEKEGEYFISRDLIDLAKSHRLLSYLKAKSVMTNSDGSVTFFTPFFPYPDGKSEVNRIVKESSPTGVCKFMGYQENIQSSFERVHGSKFFSPRPLVELDDGGRMKWRIAYSIDEEMVYQSVTCK